MEHTRPSKRRRVDGHDNRHDTKHPAESNDIYDDIEGAHNPRTLSDKRERKPTEKARLDPLRNQRDRLPTPQKPSAKVIASLGLFKPYASPKKALGLLQTPEERDVRNGEASSESDAEDVTTQRSPSQAISRARRSSVDNSWSSPSRPSKRRTYEDEIKDVAEAARRNVENDEHDSWNVLHRPKRSNAGVHSRDRDLTPISVKSSERKPSSVNKPMPFRKAFGSPQDQSRPAHHSDLGRAKGVIVGGRRSRHDEEGSIPVTKAPVKGWKNSPLRGESAVLPEATNASTVLMHTNISHYHNPAALRTPVKKGEPQAAVTDLGARSAVKGHELPGITESTKSQTVIKRVSMRDSSHTLMERSQTRKEYTFSSRELAFLKDVMLARLSGRHPIPLTGIPDEYNKVSKLILQTVEAGESNSLLIIGSRGTGKTTLVEQIIREHVQRHPNDFFVVRLNGFVHTDDKIALRDIWRQLGREMELNETEHMVKNYADTMSSLLALLSHSVESGEEDPSRVTKSVIFVIDEFDLFTHHPRQTLLYNLFDIAQSRKAPIAVIGVTTRVDVTESLEKRVKSRFSHRYVHLGLPRSVAAFSSVCKAALNVEEDDLMLMSDENTTRERQISAVSLQTIQHWNAIVEDVVHEQSVLSQIHHLYYTSKSVPRFLAAQYMIIAEMGTDVAASTEAIFDYLCKNAQKLSLNGPDSALQILTALSSLQLALLICAARLNAIYNSESSTFVLVYDEYKSLASKAKLQASASGIITQGAGGRVSSKNVARDAWNELIEYGLIMDDGRGNGKVDVGLEEIGWSGVELGQWARWCKDI